MTFLTHGALPSAETVACAKSEFNIAQSRPRDNDSDDDDDCGDDNDDDKEEEDNRDFEGFMINIIIQKQPLLESAKRKGVNEGKVYSKSALSEFNIAQSHPARDNDEDDGHDCGDDDGHC